MPHKKHIKKQFHKLSIQFKCIQHAYICPIVITWFVLPLLIMLIYNKYGLSPTLYRWIIRLYQMFSPFLSIWCPLIFSGESIEGDGHELLYINKKIKAGIFMLHFMLYCVVLAVPFIVFSFISSNMPLEYLRVVIECFFYCGSCYTIVYLLRSIPLTFMLVIAYTLSATYSNNGEKNFLCYCDSNPISKDILLHSYLPLALTGILLWISGVLINSNTERLC